MSIVDFIKEYVWKKKDDSEKLKIDQEVSSLAEFLSSQPKVFKDSFSSKIDTLKHYADLRAKEKEVKKIYFDKYNKFNKNGITADEYIGKVLDGSIKEQTVQKEFPELIEYQNACKAAEQAGNNAKQALQEIISTLQPYKTIIDECSKTLKRLSSKYSG